MRDMKKIIILGPVLPSWSEIEVIAKSLSFLKNDYDLLFLDPLTDALENPAQVNNYSLWKDRIKSYMNECVAFIGFSFGGVILRQCFDLFDEIKKKFILISVPEKIDQALLEKLNKIVVYAEQKNAELAMQEYTQSVFFSSKSVLRNVDLKENLMICRRLSVGLKAVLDISNSGPLISRNIKYLSLFGEMSNLVNVNHIEPSAGGRCVVVPNAGMRVLQDNPIFCQSIIMEELSGRE